MSAPNATLYLKNLNDQVQKDELRSQLYSLFTTHGKIIDVVASKSAKMRGQAFLVFADLAGATTAMRACEGMMFYDKPMHIEYAKTKSYATLQKEDPNFVHPSLCKTTPPTTSLSNGVPVEKRVREDDDAEMERERKRERSGNEEEIDEMEIEEEDTRTQVETNRNQALGTEPAIKHPTAALLCTNLPQEVTDDMLSVLFQQYQGFQSTHVTQSPTPTPNGRAKIAQVAFDSPDLASVAKEALDGFTLKKGWIMSVQYPDVRRSIGSSLSAQVLSHYCLITPKDLFVTYRPTRITFAWDSSFMIPATEPSSYHRIISSSLRIPTDPFTPVQVGLLACQRDPLLQRLGTNVILCTLSQGIEAPRDKKKKIHPIELHGPLYEVLLQDTILFPEGGGQPSDIGIITGKDGTSWDVLEVRRRGGHAIHYIIGGDAVSTSLTLGSGVTVTLGEEGFRRRYDHMCMHTSQHLISALLETRLNLSTPSWYLPQSPNPAYIEVPRAPTAEELKAIEEAANDFCLRGTRLHIEVEELVATEQQIDDRNASKGLPLDYTGGVNRTVVIEGVDRNPCCGTHLPSLQGLSIFVLPHTESISRGRARIFFCAGPRILAYLSQTHDLLSAAARGYGCTPTQVPERLAFEADSRRKYHKRVEELENEVATFVVRDLQMQHSKWNQSGDRLRFTAFRHRYDSSPNPLGILTTINSLWSLSSSASDPFLIVLVSSGLHSTSNHAVVLIFGSDEEEVKEIGDKLRSKGIKGGGKGRWSGKTESWNGVGGDKWIIDLIRPSNLTYRTITA